MEQKGGGKNHTPPKPLKDSSMTYDEGEDMNFQMSNLEQEIKEFDDKSMKQVYLDNFHMELKREMEQWLSS